MPPLDETKRVIHLGPGRSPRPTPPRKATTPKIAGFQRRKRVVVGRSTNFHAARERANALGLPTVNYHPSLSMTARLLEGGREAFFGFVRLAAAEDKDVACKFLQVYEDLSTWAQRRTSLDDLCELGGIRPGELLQAVVGVAFDHGADVGNLLSAAAHPRVVAQTIQSALRLDSSIGQRDREALLLHQGFMPVPKSAVVQITASASAQAAAVSAGSPSVPAFLKSVDVIADARQQIQQQLLAETSVEPMESVPVVQEADVVER